MSSTGVPAAPHPSVELDRFVGNLRGRGVLEGQEPAGPGLSLAVIDTCICVPAAEG